MSDDREAALDAMDRLLEEFEDDDAVAYAEVGGVYQEKTDLVVTGDGPRNRTAFTETGVWLRVFANGAADYRYTTSLDDESLRDVADRAIRSGEVVVDAIDAGLAHTEGLALERRWVDYTDAHIEEAMGTTTGSVVQTTLDRAQLAFSLTPVDGPKVRRHAGSTAGAAFLKTIPDCIAAAADDLERLVDADRASVDADGSLVSGESTVALSPRAAGQLFHLVAHALEADARYMGLSPYAVGDEIGPPALRIDDTVRAGSWAARAYDAEVRPTTPVTLVADGTVRRLLHNTTAAADHETEPAGHSVPSLGFTEPPRIHARHLEVAPGDADATTLRDGADVYVERFGTPWLRDEFERVQRAGVFPASVLYAKDIDEMTTDRPDRGTASFPIAEGYRLVDGTPAGRLETLALEYDPSVLASLSHIGVTRETVTGVCEKHKSRLPFAVTAPGVRLSAPLSASR
jgi:TldD protein